VEAITPRDFQDDIRLDEIITGIEHAHIAFSATNVHELHVSSVCTLTNTHVKDTYIAEQLFYHICFARHGGRLDGIFVELVLL